MKKVFGISIALMISGCDIPCGAADGHGGIVHRRRRGCDGDIYRGRIAGVDRQQHVRLGDELCGQPYRDRSGLPRVHFRGQAEYQVGRGCVCQRCDIYFRQHDIYGQRKRACGQSHPSIRHITAWPGRPCASTSILRLQTEVSKTGLPTTGRRPTATSRSRAIRAQV